MVRSPIKIINSIEQPQLPLSDFCQKEQQVKETLRRYYTKLTDLLYFNLSFFDDSKPFS